MMFNYEDQQLFDVLNLEKNLDGDISTLCAQTFLPLDVDQYLEMRNGIKEQIQDLAGTAETQDNDNYQENLEEEVPAKIYEETENQVPTYIKPAISQKIQFSEEKKIQRDTAHNGYNYETQNIGKHFKTSTSSYLTLLMKTKSLDSQEAQATSEFLQTNGAIDDFRRLFQNEGLRLKCREYYESQTFMRSILTSGKMELKSKLAMLRHLEKVRQMTFKQPEKWKIPKN